MGEEVYSRFQEKTLILRDQLAIDRTLLANERTLLAYLRFAVALVIAGLSIIHFTTAGWYWVLGFCCLPCGAIAGIIGTARYRRMSKSISLVRTQAEEKGNSNRLNNHL
jgi:putative membrane protein